MIHSLWLVLGISLRGFFIGIGIGSARRTELQNPGVRIRYFIGLCIAVSGLAIVSTLVWGPLGGVMAAPVLPAIIGFLMGAGSLPTK